MPEVQHDPDRGRWFATGCIATFALPFFILGITAVRTGLAAIRHRASDGIPLLLVGVLFSAVSIAIVLIAYFGLRRYAARSRRRKQFPMQPWLWREDWESRRVVETSEYVTPAIWAFAIAWNAITIPLTVALYRQWISRPGLTLLIVVFPLIGVALLCGAVYLSLRAIKFGRSTCTIDRLPIPIGRSFHGDIEHHGSERPESGYRIVLSCVNRIVTGSGKSRSVSDEIVWQTEGRVPPAAAAPTPSGMRVPFDLDIPPDARSTDVRDARDQTLWRLEVSAEMPGVDYKALFELPVFETTQGHSDEEVASYHARHHAEAARRDFASDSRVSTTPLPDGGIEFHVAPVRDFGVIVPILLTTIIWFVVIGAMIRNGAPLIFAIVFSLFGLIFVLMMIDLFAGSSTVIADRTGLRVRRRWFGMGREVTFAAERIDSIQSKPGARSGRRVFFDVAAHTTDGRTPAIARYLATSLDADALAAKLWFAMGKK